MRCHLHQIVLSGLCVLVLAACGSQPVRTPATYTVKAGDTLYSIAWRHHVDLGELARLNGIGPDNRIFPGQVLRLNSTAIVAKPARQWPDAAANPEKVITPSSNIPWRWPVTTARYAATTRPNGGVGLVFNGQPGQEIQSAAAGRVVYIGHGLLGYGQLVIIKHDDVFLSAYGHLQNVRIKEGQEVSANQPIASMGAGPSGTPMLYFEIRANGQPADPLTLLPDAPLQRQK